VVPVLAEDVLQVQAAVFLNVEAFVFDFGAQPSDLVGDGDDRIPADRQIGQPGKGGFFAGGRDFLAEDGSQRPGPLEAVGVRQLFDPAQQFGFQHRMEIGEGAGRMFLRQALGAMTVAEAQITGAVNADDGVGLETEIIQGLHTQESLGVPTQEVRESPTAHMADEVVQGLGDGQGGLRGARQMIEIVEDGAFQIAQVIIGRASAAQPQAKEQQPPPVEKTPVVIDQRLVASVRQLVQPPGQFREEVADGATKIRAKATTFRADAAGQSHGFGSRPGTIG